MALRWYIASDVVQGSEPEREFGSKQVPLVESPEKQYCHPEIVIFYLNEDSPL